VNRVEFTVRGTPQPQGSAKAFIPSGWGRAVITTDNKRLKPWRQDVSSMATIAMQQAGLTMTEAAVSVSVVFTFLRPKSVKRPHKITKPDIDKLLRGALDGMSGIVFRDDAQVINCHGLKNFGPQEGALFVAEWD